MTAPLPPEIRTLRDLIENAYRDTELLDDNQFDPQPFDDAHEALDALTARVRELEAALRDIDAYTRKGWAYDKRFKAIRHTVERTLTGEEAET